MEKCIQNKSWFLLIKKISCKESKKDLSIWFVRNLGDDFDVEKHFTPRYNPWDQRMCLVPDSDLFNAIKVGRASVVTDHIDQFTKRILVKQSGELIEADIIVQLQE